MAGSGRVGRVRQFGQVKSGKVSKVRSGQFRSGTGQVQVRYRSGQLRYRYRSSTGQVRSGQVRSSRLVEPVGQLSRSVGRPGSVRSAPPTPGRSGVGAVLASRDVCSIRH